MAASSTSTKAAGNRESLLRVTDLTVDFDLSSGWTRSLHGVSMEVSPGEILGLVGESGCGKSVTCMAMLQLLGPKALVQGRVELGGKNLLELDETQMTEVRGRDIAMIFQDPVSSLNPVHSIGRQIIESIHCNPSDNGQDPVRKTGDQWQTNVDDAGGFSKKEALRMAEQLLSGIGIPEAGKRLKNFPHQLSGGMNQRAMIAMALAGRPQLLIADEPTTALDVTIQAQILELIRNLRAELGMSIILVTHDLSVVAETCDRMAVMYCGRIVEEGPVQDLFSSPSHPYTRGLLTSLPRIDQRSDRLTPIPGSVPAPDEMPTGCAFEPRCSFSQDDCLKQIPPLISLSTERRIACINPQSGAL